jgi:hypothetical protein
MLKQDESPSNPNKNNKCVDTSEKVLCNIKMKLLINVLMQLKRHYVITK